MKLLLYFPSLEEQNLSPILAAADGLEVVIADDLDQAKSELPGSEILFGLFPEELFAERDESLKWIQSFSAGMDNFLFSEVKESDVTVTGASGCYGAAAADHAFGLLLMFSRGLMGINAPPGCQPKGAKLLELEGLVLGVLGLGGMGREMAKRGKGFGMRVIGIDPMITDVPESVDQMIRPDQLDEVIPDLDVLMSACALTPQSRHIINEKRLRSMKSTAYVINVSRGPIIDEAALIQALKEDWIAGAGLDVFEKEPLPADSELRKLDNAVLTHHRAGGSQNRQKKFVEVFIENLGRYRRGEPLINVVDMKRGF